MNDTAESKHNDRTMILAEVPSGRTCKLLGVIRRHRGGIHGKRRHGHAKSEFFKDFHKRWEEHKKRSHLDQWDDKDETRSQFEQMGVPHTGSMRLLRRLLDLGITKGCSFLVIQGSSTGPVLVQVRGTRVALGQGLSQRILVEILD